MGNYNKDAKLVNAVFLPAQSVGGAFAIVKTASGESLGIIKTRENRLYKIKTLFKEIFTVI